VRRPRPANADFAEAVLLRLEAGGFTAAPRFLGLDERGRQILSFIEGDVPSDTGETTFTDAQLVAAVELLRAFHQAIGGVRHGDPGPWNMVWRDSRPVALIDFDECVPGEPVYDVGYLAWKFLNFGFVDVAVAEQARRVSVLAKASWIGPAAIVAAAKREMQRMDARFPGLPRLETELRWIDTNANALVS
jgi:aminoglycoside phosphotransferase (APT) family kinase protein